MKQEREIQKYIQENDWNLNYSGNTATNIFDTEYKVILACTDEYFDIPYVRIDKKEITIKDACGYHQDVLGYEPGTAYMARALAHELSHTETYAISQALAIGLVGLGIVKAIQKQNPRYLLQGALSGLLGHVLLSEILAETGAFVIHGAGTETIKPGLFKTLDLYKTLLDLL